MVKLDQRLSLFVNDNPRKAEELLPKNCIKITFVGIGKIL